VPSLPRRWLIVAALFFVTFGISMPLAAYGVFLPIIAETFGWSRGAIATALNLVLGGIAGFFVGRLADRHGPRVMLLVTVGLAGTGFGLVSAVDALWQLYTLIGLLAGVGMSSFYLLSTTTVAHWFPDRRGLAIALVLIGFNLGYMTAGPLAAWLIAQVGWRAAYALIGFGCAALALVAASTVRLPRVSERRASLPAAVVGMAPPVGGVAFAQALADPRFWCLNVSWLLLGGTIFMFSVHAVPFARDQGVTLAIAALALTSYGVGSVVGRLVSGVLSDRFGARSMMRVAYVVELLGLGVLVAMPTPALFLLAMTVFGVGAAATDNTLVKVIPDLFGLRAIGAIMGTLTLGWRSGAALGPAAAGFLYDATGSYAVPFWTAPGLVLISWALFAIAVGGLRAPPKPPTPSGGREVRPPAGSLRRVTEGLTRLPLDSGASRRRRRAASSRGRRARRPRPP
jgi:MFS family permease